ncbi:endonuclease/exonuclease/phosphatase family protein [Geodermatophilus chilensis]|uniref:hypothetical protein n=1 Tax=Geodermatophilus chilensis TaxID=2035835 RepID=UPI001300089D|nr:hypothetical protein [Geodermatophilus chilensis]
MALTEQAQHLNERSFAIDHLAVSPGPVGELAAEVHRPGWDGGQLSDHAAYTAEVRLPASAAGVTDVGSVGDA